MRCHSNLDIPIPVKPLPCTSNALNLEHMQSGHERRQPGLGWFATEGQKGNSPFKKNSATFWPLSLQVLVLARIACRAELSGVLQLCSSSKMLPHAGNPCGSLHKMDPVQAGSYPEWAIHAPSKKLQSRLTRLKKKRFLQVSEFSTSLVLQDLQLSGTFPIGRQFDIPNNTPDRTAKRAHQNRTGE